MNDDERACVTILNTKTGFEHSGTCENCETFRDDVEKKKQQQQHQQQQQ